MTSLLSITTTTSTPTPQLHHPTPPTVGTSIHTTTPPTAATTNIHTTTPSNHQSLRFKLTPALDPVSKLEYKNVVAQVKLAIKEDAHPIRIGQGSSGSYFCRNTEGQILGVFKPKSEEPYADENPKWTKWIHKHFFCCCFGRSCLIPNVGYLSEAGACLLDLYLGFGLVPLTYIIQLNSVNFNYPRSVLRNTNELDLPFKVGSFQLFLRGFKDASHFLKLFPLPPIPPIGSAAYSITSGLHPEPISVPDCDESTDPDVGIWNVGIYDSFLNQFQRLVILDYLMRNTDRGLDNWMIKLVNNRIQIAAIDHGLAFPFKHPDQWRSYPYGWLSLPISKIPFLNQLRQYMKMLLRDPAWWPNTRTELYELFSIDEGFDGDVFEAQMALIRGQMYNLVQCLNTGGSPYDLWLTPPIIVVSHPLSPQQPVVSPIRKRGTIARLLGNRVANGLRIGSLRSSQFVYSPVTGSPSFGGSRNSGSALCLADSDAEDDLLDDQFHLAGEFHDDPWCTNYTGIGSSTGKATTPVFQSDGDLFLDSISTEAHYVHPPKRSRSLSRLDDERTYRHYADGSGYPRVSSRPPSPNSSTLIPQHPNRPPTTHRQYSFQSSPTSPTYYKERRPHIRFNNRSAYSLTHNDSTGYPSERRSHNLLSSSSLPPSSYWDEDSGWHSYRRYSIHRSGGGWSPVDDDADITDRVRAIWVHGKQKVRAGGSSLIQRARNVILEAKRKPWFENW